MSAPAQVIGLAALGRMVFEGQDIGPLFEALKAQAQNGDAGALMDLATLLMLSGQLETGAALQAQALTLQTAYRRPGRTAGAPRLLAFVAPGDLMANTPLDFLLEDADVELVSLFVEPGGAPIAAPAHDIAFLAIGESEANRPLLDAIAPHLATWPRPVLNGRADRIRALTRDGVAASLADVPSIVAPAAARLSRADLAAVAAGAAPPAAFPLIARPIASHAGQGLERLDGAEAIPAYLAARPEERFYASPFVDYAGPDGLYRKLRIVLVHGAPFICHMAVSERWMVHYLNAGMTESAAKRDEEAAFMARFDVDFARRHAGALRALHERIGLDYFGFDGAEMRDGRLLVFEADTAMIVHAMDPVDPFAYKKPVMRKLFAAFEAMLREAAYASAAA